MRSLRSGVCVAVFCIGLAACSGDKGPQGDPGQKGDQGPQGDQGPAGTPASTTGTLTGSITDRFTGDALTDVTVKATDLGGGALGSAVTGADGKFTMTVPAGLVVLSMSKPFYLSPGSFLTSVMMGGTATIAVTMSESSSGKPSVALAAPGDVPGFGVSVPLTATASDPNGDPLTYSWKNATVPPLGTVAGEGASATVTLPSLAAAFAFRPDPANPGQFISGYALPERFGVVPILTDTRGQVVASVTVSDGRGQTATASLTLNAASLHGGTRNVAVGQRLYVNSGHDTGNAWVLVAPADSTAALDNPTSRTPSFVPDRAGSYSVTEGANTMTITAGTWRGMIAGGSGNSVTPDSMCLVCHGNQFGNGLVIPDMLTPWRGTGHATMFTRGINGAASDHYSSACFDCHTVGYDKGVAANGFDDAAAAMGWSMPPMDASNWDNLIASAPSVAKLANVQCESCHGPQDSAAHTRTWDANQRSSPFLSPRISYGSESCATCHAAGAHHTYSEWSTTDPVGVSHSSRGGASRAAGATGLNASCGRCHSAQGFALYSALLGGGRVALNSVPAAMLATVTRANVEPVTCVACHDPHDAFNPSQLRFYGDTPNLPSGFAGHGLGKGALCLTCHNSGSGAQTGSDALTWLHEDGEPYNGGNPTDYNAPHAAQGDVLTGHNAYFLGSSLPMTSKHAAVQDTCAGCHMGLQPKGYLSQGALARSGHLFRIEPADRQALCANCHGSAVDGAGIQGEVDSQLARIATAMGSAVKAKINGFPGGLVRVRAWDPATDLYSSISLSNLVLDVVANPVTAVDVSEIHGYIGFILHFAVPITVPFVDANGNPAPSKALTSFGVQMGAIRNNAATPAALYALSGNLVRAGWNYFLIEGDRSRGLHNPGFVTAVLSATFRKDLSN